MGFRTDYRAAMRNTLATYGFIQNWTPTGQDQLKFIWQSCGVRWDGFEPISYWVGWTQSFILPGMWKCLGSDLWLVQCDDAILFEEEVFLPALNRPYSRNHKWIQQCWTNFCLDSSLSFLVVGLRLRRFWRKLIIWILSLRLQSVKEFWLVWVGGAEDSSLLWFSQLKGWHL